METMTDEQWAQFCELYNEMSKIQPPTDCELKEISPGVFAYVFRTDDTNANTTE